jgi:hypothetical protein
LGVQRNSMNPTPGYKNWFEASLIDVYPPEFTLFLETPQGFQVQILAYFCCWAQFNASKPVEFVVVHDAGGPKRVKVDQAHDLAEAKPGQGTEWVLCSGGWVSSG